MDISEKQLVMFGNYLLGKKRRDLFKALSQKGFQSLGERLENVHDSDLSFFRAMIKKKKPIGSSN